MIVTPIVIGSRAHFEYPSFDHGFFEPLGAIMTQPGRKTGLRVSTLENDFTHRVMEIFLSDMFAVGFLVCRIWKDPKKESKINICS